MSQQHKMDLHSFCCKLICLQSVPPVHLIKQVILSIKLKMSKILSFTFDAD